MIALPLAPTLDIPQWDVLVAKATPSTARIARDGDDLATIV